MQSSEDYSYFHLVPASPHPTTIFGISCNRQIKTSELLVKEEDMTRSTVQKAVVVLASKPLFGPIRDKLGVVTQALFSQRYRVYEVAHCGLLKASPPPLSECLLGAHPAFLIITVTNPSCRTYFRGSRIHTTSHTLGRVLVFNEEDRTHRALSLSSSFR